jgi:basic membrane lipoprotein Med (substrate-binding protein (PBP1-ABC) superfamily)/DNA-binding SARP family transcriptional activator
MRAVTPARATGAGLIAPTLGGPKQRLVLALLLSDPNTVVPMDRLVDGVWDGQPPGTARHTVQAYVSELRKELGDQIERSGSGYRVAVDRDTLDTLEFEARVSSGRSLLESDPDAAIEELRAALALWHGNPFEDFPESRTLQVERARLDELRLVASEDLIRARLATGQHADVIVDLLRLTEEHPYREELRALHMVALYRSGRQADALREFQRTRRILDDDLGIVPSPRLRRLEEQILLQDPELEAPARPTVRTHQSNLVENPYLGLRAFQEADEDRFFGRDELIRRLVDRVRDDCRFTAVVGPSGSGKSSVVQAGVIPRLRRESPTIRVVTMQPGTQPFAELHAALDRVSSDQRSVGRFDGDRLVDAVVRSLPPGTTRLLLVIDQFEELFTMADHDTIERFLDLLLHALVDVDSRLRVIVTLRADFYDRPLANATFGSLFADNVVNVVALSPDQLEAAATLPARRLDVELEPRLVGRLLADVAGQPNALPLFQFALTELFDERTSSTLELSTYERIGGVRKAVARRAESLFERFDTDEQEAARQLFLRIATISDGIVGRRRVPASELVSLDVDVVALQTVIDQFARYRLLALDRDPASGVPTIEVAHEALLAEWARLRDWIDESRADLLTQMSFATALREWEAARRSPGYLLTGARLADYENWATTTRLRLTTAERAFLDESIAARDIEAAEADARRTQQARSRRRSRRQVVLLFFVAAALTGVIAYPLLTTDHRDTIAIALSNRRSDGRFDELLARGLEQAAHDSGFDAVVLEPPYSNAADAIRRAITDRTALMFGSFLMADTLIDIAPEYPDTTFVVMDNAPRPEPNVVTIDFAVEQGSFLVGAAAALESRSAKVGYIGANSLPHIEAFRAGFEQGATAADPHTEVVSRLIRPPVGGEPRYDGYTESAIAKQIATTMYLDDGVDVIFVAAGDSGRGVAEAATELSTPSHKLWMVGVDNDQLYDLPADQRDHVLTSMVKRFDVGLATVAAAQADGSLVVPSAVRLTLADDAVGFTTSGGFLDAAILSTLDGFRSDIVDGGLTVDPVPRSAISEPVVVASPDATRVSFDGTACTVDGPQTYPIGDEQQFVFANHSGHIAGVTVWKVPDGTSTEAVQRRGFSLDDVNSKLRAIAEAAPGGDVIASAMIDEPGDWLVMCVDDADHPGSIVTVGST